MEEFGIDHLKKIVKESIEAGMSWGKALEDGKVSIGEWIGSGKESVDVIIALKDYKLIVKEALNISPEETKELSDYVLKNVKGLEEEEEASKWIKWSLSHVESALKNPFVEKLRAKKTDG